MDCPAQYFDFSHAAFKLLTERLAAFKTRKKRGPGSAAAAGNMPRQTAESGVPPNPREKRPPTTALETPVDRVSHSRCLATGCGSAEAGRGRNDAASRSVGERSPVRRPAGEPLGRSRTRRGGHVAATVRKEERSPLGARDQSPPLIPAQKTKDKLNRRMAQKRIRANDRGVMTPFSLGASRKLLDTLRGTDM